MEAGPSNDYTGEVPGGQHEEEQIEMVIEGEVFDGGIIEEEDEIMDGVLDGEYDCSARNNFEANHLFQMYQPLESDQGLMCKICYQCMGKQVMFTDRASYNAHRYKVHGSFNNSIVCPLSNCKDAFASTIHLRRHLIQTHELPLEMHHRIFSNMADFERWRRLVERASSSRFIMHTKQPNRKRQIMHCAKSEHKQVLQSRTRRLPRTRMEKEGSCCPAVISYRQEPTSGVVHSFYQLYHVGHAVGDDREVEGEDVRPITLHFVEPPTYMGDRPMQYVQIDFVEMESGVYQTLVYSYVMVMTDLHTGYTWSKPMSEPLSKLTLLRIINDIFCQFGIPDGFSSSSGPWQGLVRECMNQLEGVFFTQIKEIYNEGGEYEGFRAALLEDALDDFKVHTRWPEVVPFTTMNANQSGKVSAFERFFKRKPCSINPPPYLPDEADDIDWEEYNPSVPVLDCGVKSKVYLKNNDLRHSRNGGYQPFLYGTIGEIDYSSCPHFPYKVHYSRTEEPGPNENSPYVWASPYDILTMERDSLNSSGNDASPTVSELFCVCKAGTSEEPCQLFRSFVCTNEMAKTCCQKSGHHCGYHQYSTGDDSYPKMEKLTRYYSTECSARERKDLRAHLKIPKEKYDKTTAYLGNDPHQEGDLLVEVAAEEVVGDGAGEYYLAPDSPTDPPVKRRRNRVKAGAGSIIVTSAESQAEIEVLRGVSVEPGPSNHSQQPQLQHQPVEVPIQRVQEEPVEQEESRKRKESSPAQLEEYIPPPSATGSKRQSQDSVRRSGRPAKVKVYKDFVTE